MKRTARMKNVGNGLFVGAMFSTCLLLAGCGNVETTTGPESTKGSSGSPSADTGTTDSSTASDELDLSKVVFLHANPTGFPVNAVVTSATTSGNHHIDMSFNRPRYSAESGIDANVWVFGKVDGQWYAATFEWVRVGATGWNKDLEATKSQAPFVQTEVSPLNSWRPAEGETVYFMVSSICRGGARGGVQGRSEPFKAVWHR